jgi:hypothetical protein
MLKYSLNQFSPSSLSKMWLSCQCLHPHEYFCATCHTHVIVWLTWLEVCRPKQEISDGLVKHLLVLGTVKGFSGHGDVSFGWLWPAKTLMQLQSLLNLEIGPKFQSSVYDVCGRSASLWLHTAGPAVIEALPWPISRFYIYIFVPRMGNTWSWWFLTALEVDIGIIDQVFGISDSTLHLRISEFNSATPGLSTSISLYP